MLMDTIRTFLCHHMGRESKQATCIGSTSPQRSRRTASALESAAMALSMSRSSLASRALPWIPALRSRLSRALLASCSTGRQDSQPEASRAAGLGGGQGARRRARS
jgi:hypothetical protein